MSITHPQDLVLQFRVGGEGRSSACVNNEPSVSSCFIVFLLFLVLSHFHELEEQEKDKETPDTGVQDTGFHFRARKILRSGG